MLQENKNANDGVIKAVQATKDTFAYNDDYEVLDYLLPLYEDIIPSPKAPPQFTVVSTLYDCSEGIPLAVEILNDKDRPEPLTCAYVLKQLLTHAANTFPEITYVVGDNTFCTLETITTVRQLGKHVIAGVPASCKEAKALINQYPQLKDHLEPLVPLDNRRKAFYGCLQRGQLYGGNVNLLLVYTPPLKGRSNTFKTRAQKEKKDLSKKLSAQFASSEDFVATVSKQQTKAKYCKITVQDAALAAAIEAAAQATTNTKKRTTQKKGSKAATATAFVTPEVTVEISEDMLDLAMNIHNCHVLFCTDFDISASEIYGFYKSSKEQTSMWNRFPSRQLILPSKILEQAPNCADGIVSMMAIIAALCRIYEQIVKVNMKLEFIEQ